MTQVIVTKALTDKIHNALNAIGKSHFIVGKYLNEAKAVFTDKGHKKSDWLAWALEEFGLRKAQVYKLTKVYDMFGDDEKYSQIAMSILYAIATTKIEDLKEKCDYVIDQEGKLELPRFKEIEASLQPEPPQKPVLELVEDGDKEKPEQGKGGDKSTETAGSSEQATGGEEVQDTIDTLKNIIEGLKEELELVRAEKAKAQATKPKALAPVLPQFSNECSYAVLGLSFEQAEDAATVKQAARALMKLYPAKDYPEASEAIKSAKENLLTSAK